MLLISQKFHILTQGKTFPKGEPFEVDKDIAAQLLKNGTAVECKEVEQDDAPDDKEAEQDDAPDDKEAGAEPIIPGITKSKTTKGGKAK
jgi:hypothetical protein